MAAHEPNSKLLAPEALGVPDSMQNQKSRPLPPTPSLQQEPRGESVQATSLSSHTSTSKAVEAGYSSSSAQSLENMAHNPPPYCPPPLDLALPSHPPALAQAYIPDQKAFYKPGTSRSPSDEAFDPTSLYSDHAHDASSSRFPASTEPLIQSPHRKYSSEPLPRYASRLRRRASEYPPEKISFTLTAEMDVPTDPVNDFRSPGMILSRKRIAGLAEMDSARFSYVACFSGCYSNLSNRRSAGFISKSV